MPGLGSIWLRPSPVHKPLLEEHPIVRESIAYSTATIMVLVNSAKIRRRVLVFGVEGVEGRRVKWRVSVRKLSEVEGVIRVKWRGYTFEVEGICI